MLKTLLKTSLLSVMALALVLPMDAAQAQRGRGRGLTQPVPGFAPGFDAHLAGRSLRHINEATEQAFRVERLAARVSSGMAAELTDEGYVALEAARTAHAAGDFFRAGELAKASKALFEAAKNLYEGELGYKVDPYGQPEAPSRSYFDAPFRAQERLFRVQAELNFSNQTVNPVASRLVGQAQQLATANPAEVGFNTDFRILAEHRAAYEMAKAATHLLAAERGF